MKGTMAPRTPGLRKVMDRMFDPFFRAARRSRDQDGVLVVRLPKKELAVKSRITIE